MYSRGLPDHVVGRKHAHHRVGIDRLQNVRRQADRRRRIALRRLGQNLALGNFGKLLDDLRAQMIVGQNPDALRRKHRAQAIDGLLDQRPVAEEAQDLFGVGAAAARPEARARGRRRESGRNDETFCITGSG